MNALRARPLLALSLGVLAAHLWLAGEMLPDRLGEGAGDAPRRRIEVAFVRELAPAAVAPAPPRRELPRMRPQAPAPAASAPAEQQAPAIEAPLEPPLPAASQAIPEPMPPLAALPELPALAEAAPPTAASAAQRSVEWPPSTRLSYRLTGNVRGPVEGQAKVEWLRTGTRYQVFLEASVGPSFAPLLTRRESSEGEITPEGLSPRRYDMEMRLPFRDPRRTTILMEPTLVRLPNGQEVARAPGLQDAVSQFVHLTWLFNTQPDRLVQGQSVEMPLALPRRVEAWAYDVIGPDSLLTSAGPVATVHIKPRREARAGDYTAEIWIAPSLQYLPVRIVVRQDAETFIDLQLERLPEQAVR